MVLLAHLGTNPYHDCYCYLLRLMAIPALVIHGPELPNVKAVNPKAHRFKQSLPGQSMCKMLRNYVQNDPSEFQSLTAIHFFEVALGVGPTCPSANAATMLEGCSRSDAATMTSFETSTATMTPFRSPAREPPNTSN